MNIISQPFIILLLFVLLSRYLTHVANKKLDPDKKAELIDLFSQEGFYSLAISILAFACYYFLVNYNIISPEVGIIAYIVVLLGFIIFNAVRVNRMLSENDFPRDYITSYLIASSMRFIGIIVFFVLLFFNP